jgi:threonyl-tRNA synthetase
VKEVLSKFRVELDLRNEKMGYKIRASQTQKIPFTLVLGDQEVENQTVTIRRYGSQDQETMSLEAFKSLCYTLNMHD